MDEFYSMKVQLFIHGIWSILINKTSSIENSQMVFHGYSSWNWDDFNVKRKIVNEQHSS
jgi:hypothetical protein